MYEITCPATGLAVTLGAGDRISSHRTSEGTITYLRCTCGAMVLAVPGGVRHAGVEGFVATAPEQETLTHHLQRLAALALHTDWTPEQEAALADVVERLVSETASQDRRAWALRPRIGDTAVAHLRTLGRLATMTAGRPIALRSWVADQLEAHYEVLIPGTPADEREAVSASA